MWPTSRTGVALDLAYFKNSAAQVLICDKLPGAESMVSVAIV